MGDKIKKSTVLYVFQPGSKYTCSECAFVTPLHKCSMYVSKDEDVLMYGSCNLWQPLDMGRIEGNKTATKEGTGYMVNPVGFTCARCEEFLPDAKECKKVEGKIDPKACCNRWERDPQTGDLEENKLRSMKEFR
jgi:hypothetical protein